MKRPLRLVLCGLLALGALGLVLASDPAEAQKPKKKPNSAALKRTRKMVKMLDDIYKQTIVLITSKYVDEESDYPAGRAAIRLFKGISENGWHGVRLIDVSGHPSGEANVAKDAFEKEGIKKLKAGKDYYEQIVEKDGKPYLRAITAVPVVLDKCILCHPHYKDAKKGEPVGALSYTVEIE